MKKTRNLAITWLMPIGTILQFMLPRWFTTKVARFLGEIAYILNAGKRAKLIENYRHILGVTANDSKLNLIARRAFVNLAVFYADLLRLPVMKKKVIHLVKFDKQNLEKALKPNRGLILVTAHIGNWDLAGVFLTALGYRVSAVVEPIPRGWTKTFDRYRRIFAMETIPIPEHNRINNAIKQGRIVALVADRDLTGHGILCPAFDAFRSFPKGPAVYALRHRVPLLFGYLVYQKKKNNPPYLGIIEPPIEFRPTSDMDRDIEELTKLIATRINHVISLYPDQWLVFNAAWI